jgi:hypothetical protein
MKQRVKDCFEDVFEKYSQFHPSVRSLTLLSFIELGCKLIGREIVERGDLDELHLS